MQKLPGRLTLATLCLFLCFLTGFGQNKSTATLLERKERARAAKIAIDQKIKEAEQKLEAAEKSSINTFTHGQAIERLVQLKKERIILHRSPESLLGLKREEAQKFFYDVRNDHAKAVKLLETVSAIYKLIGAEKSTAAAGVKLDLAWFALNPVGFVRDFEIDAAFAKADTLYVEALALQEQTTGADSDLTLSTILTMCDFYKIKADYENALALYERYVAAVEKRYGSKTTLLAMPLRELGNIAANTERQSEADEIAARVSLITGKPEKYRPGFPDLINRATHISRVHLSGISYHDRSTMGGFSGLGMAEEIDAPVITNSWAKRIVVGVLVDETGTVIETKLIGATKKGDILINAARSTKFRPFVYKGIARRIWGGLAYSIVE